MTRRIIVIEDDRDIAHLMQIHLEDLGYRVDLAYDGAQGWEQVLATAYDLIILDLLLPLVDGLEICRRARSRLAYTPILMLTAKSTEPERVAGLGTGRGRLPYQAVQHSGVAGPRQSALSPRRGHADTRHRGRADDEFRRAGCVLI